MMIFFIFANFSKSRKNWRFSQPRPWRPFSLISHLCPDFIQMSEFLYLSCPDVKLWWFSSFSQTFRKIEKIEDFPIPGPGDPFPLFHTCAQISSKWVNFYILVVLMSNYDDFLHFRKLLKNRKNWRFSPPRPWGPFSLIPNLCPDFIQISEFDILVVLMSNFDDFLHFHKLFEKSKKLKIFPTPALGPLSLISHLCPDFIQMSEFLYLSCPDVNCDDFLHFRKLFEKLTKLKIFPPRPWGPFSLISNLCPDFIQRSEFLYLSCPDVKWWWFSSLIMSWNKSQPSRVPIVLNVFW